MNNQLFKSMIKCRNCKFWSGQIGSHNEWSRERNSNIKSKVLICAVNIPNPSDTELELVDGRLCDTVHSCNSFEAYLSINDTYIQ